MVVELETGTDVALHVIYDPAAVSHIDMTRCVPDDEFITRETAQGNLLIYDTASDGSSFFRVYVDEPLPDDLACHESVKTENLMLKVPSGRLVAGGLEYINDVKKLSRAKPFDPTQKALVTCSRIIPGNYVVDAYEFDWDWDREIVPILKRELGSAAYLRKVVGGGMGCVFLLAAIGALITGFLLSVLAKFEFPWPLFLVVCVVVGAFGVLLIRMATPRAYAARKRAIEARFPSNVLVLKRLPDGADLSRHQGGGFGIAFGSRAVSEEPRSDRSCRDET